MRYRQHDRELLLAALLDIKLGTFKEGLKDDKLFALCDETSIADVLGGYIHSMEGASRATDQFDELNLALHSQCMFQNIAMAADVTLHRIVDYFGKSPWPDRLWCGHKPYNKFHCAVMECSNYVNKGVPD
jgi:hypothetical protein